MTDEQLAVTRRHVAAHTERFGYQQPNVEFRKGYIEDLRTADLAGNIKFCSLTVRAFKLDLEDLCEDYGQVATYLGTLPGEAHRFVLDYHHTFETGRPMLVCGNTADMVGRTRFGGSFPHQRRQAAPFQLVRLRAGRQLRCCWRCRGFLWLLTARTEPVFWSARCW